MSPSDNNTPRPRITKNTIFIRSVAVVLLIAAIAYIVLPLDFDSKGAIGYIDDFFIFMGAFTLLRASLTKPERKFVKRQLYMISASCFLLGLLWLAILCFI